MQVTVLPLRWYVIRTQAKLERRIEQAMGLLDIENYLPRRLVMRKWSDRIKKIEEPLFPNYIFARLILSRKTEILKIKGVLNLVSCQGIPCCLRNQEIERIKLIESVSKNINTESIYQRGDKIRVVNGVFSGLEGILIHHCNQARILIQLPILKQAVSVAILIGDVLKILD